MRGKQAGVLVLSTFALVCAAQTTTQQKEAAMDRPVTAASEPTLEEARSFLIERLPRCHLGLSAVDEFELTGSRLAWREGSVHVEIDLRGARTETSLIAGSSQFNVRCGTPNCRKVAKQDDETLRFDISPVDCGDAFNAQMRRVFDVYLKSTPAPKK